MLVCFVDWLGTLFIIIYKEWKNKSKKEGNKYAWEKKKKKKRDQLFFFLAISRQSWKLVSHMKSSSAPPSSLLPR